MPLCVVAMSSCQDELYSRLNGQVNRKGDEIAQMATEYTALEIAYFKAVVRLLGLTRIRICNRLYRSSKLCLLPTSHSACLRSLHCEKLVH